MAASTQRWEEFRQTDNLSKAAPNNLAGLPIRSEPATDGLQEQLLLIVEGDVAPDNNLSPS